MIEKKDVLSKDGVRLVYYTHFLKNNNQKKNDIKNNEKNIKLIQKTKHKPTLVFLHGAWSNHSVWKKWFAYFENHQYIAMDLRNRGESGEGDLSFKCHLDDLKCIFEKEKINEVIFIGNSFGAVLAYEWYLRNPKNTKKLVLFSFFARPFLRARLFFLALTYFFKVIFLFLPRRKRKMIDYAELAHSSYFFTFLKDMQGIHISDMLEVFVLLLNKEVDLKKIKIPVLDIEGKHDLFINANIIADQKNTNHILEKVSGAHRLVNRESEEIIKKIKKFIEE